MLLDKVQKKNYFIINNEVWALIPARIGSKSIKKGAAKLRLLEKIWTRYGPDSPP
jgi:hypothetical protein